MLLKKMYQVDKGCIDSFFAKSYEKFIQVVYSTITTIFSTLTFSSLELNGQTISLSLPTKSLVCLLFLSLFSGLRLKNCLYSVFDRYN